MTKPKPPNAWRKGVALCAVLTLLTSAAEADAEPAYKLSVAAYRSAITLSSAGVGGFAFGVANGIYLERGADDDVGRIVTGVGSLVHCSVMVVAGALTLYTATNVPPLSSLDEERNDAFALGIANVALAALNFSLGVATLVSFDGDVPKPERDESSVQLSPTAAVDEHGATIGLVGRF